MVLFDEDIVLSDEAYEVQNYCNVDESCELPADTCTAGSAGYHDIIAGAQIRVTDESGDVVGIGELGGGLIKAGTDAWDSPTPCAFYIVVKSIEAEGDIFGVEVANRGVIQFHREEADAVNVTLGEP
ncbi:hypothetical protein [Nocardioides sp. NPDC127503]|uniref:hypothetical protein n=1 Tax=Nocardioides sp. NPDC127503 TaxID=3154516 RepID=UPI00332B4BA2